MRVPKALKALKSSRLLAMAKPIGRERGVELGKTPKEWIAYAVKHRVRICLSVTFAFVVAFQTIVRYSPDSLDFILSWICIILTLGMVRFVRVAGVSLALLFAIFAVVPEAPVSSALKCCYLALGLLAYECGNLLTVCATALVAAGWLFATVIYDGVGWSQLGVLLGGMLINYLMIIGSALIGRSMRWKDMARRAAILDNQLRQKQEQLDIQQHNAQLSSVLHDSLAGTLTDIDLLCEQALEGNKPDENNELTQDNGIFGIIQERARSGNAILHRVIRTMRNYDPVQDTGSNGIQNKDFITTVSQILSQEDARLQQLGFDGSAIIKGSAEIVDSSVAELVTSIIKEIYNNIVRHCDPDNREYTCVANLSEHEITLFEMNSARNDPQFGGVGGTGLDAFKQRLHALGGSLIVEREEVFWTIKVCIPC